MRRFRLFFLFSWTFAVPLFGQAPVAQPAPTLSPTASHTWNLAWTGIFDRTYFLQCSPDLEQWVYLPNYIESGTDQVINYGLSSPNQKVFFRLAFSDIYTSDPDVADFDGDGVGNLQEITVGTDPLDLDTDDDGLTNAEEIALGTNMTNPDSDGDGISDGGEIEEGSDPNDATDTPDAEWLVVTGDLAPGVAKSRNRSLTIPAGESRLVIVAIASAEYPTFTSGAEENFEFNDLLTWSVKLDGKDVSSGTIDVNARDNQWDEALANNQTLRGFDPVHYESVKLITAPSDTDGQVELELSATNIEDGGYHSTVFVGLLPMEVAPEVLAVNSDFDEGRIDPATGYAIPDCDDVAGVDPKTGAGNGELVPEAVRNHLDGKFGNGEQITEDMHKGWFGLNPNQLPDDFWDGSTVTIRKVDKIDEDTGRKESGQIRFYAFSEDGYVGIVPYDLSTLAPTNLVVGGINKVPNQGVYGSTSTIPDHAEFYMEGVRPGKITLEWRLQKGEIDVSYEQTFLIETQWSPAEWKDDLAYKIRLDTSNDPSGQIDVNVDPRRAALDYWVKVERMSEYYDYYQENYLTDDNFQWSGLARLAGSQVIAGVSDASYATLLPSLPVRRIIDEIFTAMAEGGYDIFDSLAWQHHAYRRSGLGALEWTNDNFQDQDLDELFSIQRAWHDYDDGVNDEDFDLVQEAAYKMTDYEQNSVIVPTWDSLRRITLENGDVTHVYTTLGENVMTPNGDRFTVAVPQGNLGNTGDRWKWIEDTASGSPNGIIGAWKAGGKAGQRALVIKTLKEDSLRFSQMQIIIQLVNDAFLIDPFDLEDAEIRVNDHLDIP